MDISFTNDRSGTIPSVRGGTITSKADPEAVGDQSQRQSIGDESGRISMETVPKESVFNFDFAIENAWQRSFKRMKRAIAASVDNDAV